MTVKSSISPIGERHAFARALVEAERYAGFGAVLQRGRDLPRRGTEIEELEWRRCANCCPAAAETSLSAHGRWTGNWPG